MDEGIVHDSIITADDDKATKFDDYNINDCNNIESVDTNLITFFAPPKSCSTSTMNSDFSPVDSDSGLLMTDFEQLSSSSTSSSPPAIVGSHLRSPRINLNMTRPFSAQETNLFAFAVPMIPMPKIPSNSISSGSLGLNIFVNPDLQLHSENVEEEKFLPAQEFADTINANDWDVLLGSNTGSVSRDSKWDRESLYQRFDPLLNRGSPPKGLRKQREMSPKNNSSSSLVEDEMGFFGNNNKKSLTGSVNESDVLVMVDEEENVNFCMREFGKENMTGSRDVTIVENETFIFTDEMSAIEIENGESRIDQVLAQQLTFESAIHERDEQINDLEQRLAHQVSVCNGHKTLKYQLEDAQNQRRIAESKIDEYKLSLLKGKNEKLAITSECEELVKDLQNVESAFKDVHTKYERVKYHSQKNEELLMQRDAAMQLKVSSCEAQVDEIKEAVKDKLEIMFQDYETKFKTKDDEISRLRAQLRKAVMKVEALENDGQQKKRELAELSKLCDDLINRQVK